MSERAKKSTSCLGFGRMTAAAAADGDGDDDDDDGDNDDDDDDVVASEDAVAMMAVRRTGGKDGRDE